MILLAVNGLLVDGPRLVHDSPAMPSRSYVRDDLAPSSDSLTTSPVAADAGLDPVQTQMATSPGLPVTREMVGGKLLPFVVLEGAECEVSFSADYAVQDLGAEFVGLAAFQASNIKARCSNEELSIDLADVEQTAGGLLTTEERLSWEAFFLNHGSRPHLHTCAEPSFWNGHDGQCAICLSAFMDSDPAVEVATCQHRFHSRCIQQWLSRKQTCPVCRGTAKPEEIQPIEEKGPMDLSRSIAETLGKLVLMAPGSRGRRLLLQALNTYSSRSLTADILMSTTVPTTQGLKPLEEVFVESTYARFAGNHVPYLSVSRVPPDMANVLGALGVASILNVRGVLKAIVLLGQQCRTNEGPEQNSRLDLFAGLYGALDGILREEAGRDARVHAVRKCFEESAVIFVQNSLLCRTDEALWEGNTLISTWLNQPVIGHLYPSLRFFFEDVLHIPSLGLQHCVLALRSMAREEFQRARLDKHSLLSAARITLAEVERLALQAEEQGDEEGSLGALLARTQHFPLLSDGTQPSAQHSDWTSAIRECGDCMCFLRDGVVYTDIATFAEHACVNTAIKL